MPMTATTRVDLENCMIDELRNNGANEILAVLGIAIRI